jgi:hypothetical protein
LGGHERQYGRVLNRREAIKRSANKKVISMKAFISKDQIKDVDRVSKKSRRRSDDEDDDDDAAQ